jgi:hypothetical protein
LIGKGVTITNIDVSVSGTSIGSVINWDWEVHLGTSPFGLPEGQFDTTHVDPVSGYTRVAPTQLQFVVGAPPSPIGSEYTFSGSYDFLTGTMTAMPLLGSLKNASTTEMNLTDGLYAQLFFWTGDNRNCHILFENPTLTVHGKMRIPTPKHVGIDIQPGSDTNCFNQNERGVIPVAILGAADLDVKQIKVDSLSLQGLSVKMAGKRSGYLAHYDYVNGDAYLDLVVQFADSDGWTASGTDNAVLTGTLLDGTPIEGKDSICIVPWKKR